MSERPARLRRSTSGLAWCLCLAAAAAEPGYAADAPGAVARASVTDPTALRQCQFIEGTLDPVAAIGSGDIKASGDLELLSVLATMMMPLQRDLGWDAT